MIIELTHQKQKYNWDCGLACILMVLPTSKRQYFLKNFEKICKDESFGKSTWTIDLCYLLLRFQVNHKYLTRTLGVNPDHKKSSFYYDVIKQDACRVNKRFLLAKEVGLHIQRGQVNLNEILLHLEKFGPIILLTNSRLLKCETCIVNKIHFELRRCLKWKTPPTFQGHYIVLCGHAHYSQKGRILYRNPSLTDHICSMSYETLEQSRLSYGTDEDIIFIFN